MAGEMMILCSNNSHSDVAAAKLYGGAPPVEKLPDTCKIACKIRGYPKAYGIRCTDYQTDTGEIVRSANMGGRNITNERVFISICQFDVSPVSHIYVVDVFRRWVFIMLPVHTGHPVS